MICEKNKCTACGACLNACPKEAITMLEDEYGNIYPSINNKKCINCGLCRGVCPQLNNKTSFHKSTKIYAMYCKNQDVRSESSSGGAATLFYESILEENGVVYGASNLFCSNKFNFVKVLNKNDLYKIKGSKYVHCYTDNIYKDVKEELKSNKKVLFIGTPCQVDGLKSYLMKDYKNLFCVDIICHGVPSQKLLFDELNNLNIKQKDINYIIFRDDNGFTFKVIDSNNKILKEEPSNKICYYNNFLEGNIYRENCYNCKYAKRERISDVTIGDFWGLDKTSKVYDDEKKGISLIMQNTGKGCTLIKSIMKDCVIEERPLEEPYKGNGQLNHPMNKNKKYTIYKKYYPLLGYKKTCDKMILFKDKIKLMIKNKSLLYKIYKNNK